MKSSVIIGFLSAIIFASPCCKKNDVKIDPVPSISMISPSSGVSGTLVSVTGEHFPTIDSSKIIMKFNNTTAEILRILPDEIRTLVPVGAGSGNVTLTFDTTELSGPYFGYSPSWIIQGSDMGDKFQSVNVNYENQPVGNATVKVNGTLLPKNPTYPDRYYGALPVPVPPGGSINLEVGLADGTTFSASGMVPEKPELTVPADNSSFTKTQSLTVNWTCPSNPDRFSIALDFNPGTQDYKGITYETKGMNRSFSFDLSSAPTGTLDITVFSYSDGAFTGSPLSGYSNMNIRNESNVVHATIH